MRLSDNVGNGNVIDLSLNDLSNNALWDLTNNVLAGDATEWKFFDDEFATLKGDKSIYEVKIDNEVIPKENKNTLKVDRLSFSLAVDRVSTITTDKLPVIKLKIMNNMVNLTSVNNESGTATEDMNVNYSGDEIEIGFNSKYILEMINNLEDETVILEFKDSASPVIAKEESNPNLIYVLMPMRV